MILQGGTKEIIPPYGANQHSLENLGKNPTEPHKLAGKWLSMFEIARYSGRNLLDFARKQENCMVCIPSRSISKLRECYIEAQNVTGTEFEAFR